MLNDKRVLVCGAKGFIGHAIVRQLGTTEAEIYATDHEDFDLTTVEGWNRALIGAEPEIVFMCAAVTGGVGMAPLDLVTDNVLMHAHMFRSCVEHGVKRIVMMSSTTGYPDLDGWPLPEDLYFDGDVHPAYQHAGHTRRFIERMAEMYADKIEVVRVRVSNAYGPGDNYDPITSHVIAASIRKVAERQDPITIWGDGSEYRDALHIEDVARGIVMAAEWPAGAYNFASGEEMSVTDICLHLAQVACYDAAFQFDTSHLPGLRRRVLDCAKAHTLGWKPTIAMREGLKSTLERFNRHG